MFNEYRKRANLTQEKVAELANIDPRTYQRIEKKEAMPLIDTFGKIAITLDMSNEEIGKEIRKIVIRKDR